MPLLLGRIWKMVHGIEPHTPTGRLNGPHDPAPSLASLGPRDHGKPVHRARPRRR
jgi:hypothetical protein